MLDDELREAVKAELPSEIPSVFISSITQQGVVELKDLIWKTLHDKG
jgi:GTP-binding protein